MSTFTNQPSSTLRPYIGSRRNRNYFNNTTNISSLSNNYTFSTNSPSESNITIESEQQNYLLNTKTADDLGAREKEQLPVKTFSYGNLQEERQPHLREDQEEKEFFSSSPSSSLFFSPNTHDTTPLSAYDHSFPYSSLVTEQQHSNNPFHQYAQYPYWQSLNSEEENNQFKVLEKREEANKEQQKQIESSIYSISSRNQNFDLSDVQEENSLLSSGYSLTDTAGENNNNDNQSYLSTSTPVFFPRILHTERASNNIISTLLSDKNYNSELQPLEFDIPADQLSIGLTDGLVTDLQYKTDACRLNDMSSLRYSSNSGSSKTRTYPFDQRITDQGFKYIIQLRTDEYQENEFTIKPRYSFNQLIIDAKHREEDNSGGYIHRELHKVFNIPKHIDLNQYSYSYNKEEQELTIEMPYLQLSTTANENQNGSSTSSIPTAVHASQISTQSNASDNRNDDGHILSTQPTHLNYNNCTNHTSSIGLTTSDTTSISNTNTTAVPVQESSMGNTKPFDFDLFHRSVFRPQIVRATSDGNYSDRKLIMSLDLSDYQPEDIKVSVKERELIVQAERKFETDTRKSRTSFFQSTSLPPHTDIEHLQSNYVDGKLVIEAPYIDPKSIEQKVIGTSSVNPTNQGSNW